MSITPWASQPLEAGINQALSAMEAGMHVALIATFDLKTCKVSDVVEEVLTHPELKAFDFIPVRDENDIVGVLYRPYSRKCSTGCLYRSFCQRTDSNTSRISGNSQIIIDIGGVRDEIG
ncbi:hypothetical protein [Allocoleopsis franciscana]|uniref:Uncharacterized protein n=1 Tax=Allocoleopsis franciscana PCC 7113 TaxID=1173027 RepID=K9WMN6_9CYAN|nr:hypothetical protein [Allocoleopsis franciscana]AFZ21660.1 hypothetical protein Mic7113_6061 [Allocoleopsis franciscana PCC 7113]